MSIKIQKFLIILAAAFIFIIIATEALWLFVVPKLVNNQLKQDIIKNKLYEKTKLKLSYERIYIKTTPDISTVLYLKNVKLCDTNNTTIMSLESMESKLHLPELIFKKINIKQLKANDFLLHLTRNKEGKLFLGEYKLPEQVSKTAQDFDFKINKISVKTNNIHLIVDDKAIKKKININVKQFDINKYQKDKFIDLVLLSNISVNKKHAEAYLTFSSKLPLNQGLDDKKFKLSGHITNIDLNDYSDYITYFSKNNIIKANGILNAEFSSDKDIIFNVSLENFALNMKNELDSIKADSTITLNSRIFPDSRNINIKNLTLKSKNWQTDIIGSIEQYKTRKPELNLKVHIPDSDIHSMYWLIPSIEEDPQDVMQKFKKYGAWGKAKGNLEIKGDLKNPEVYGDLEAYDVYIVKDNPLVPHCKIFAKFLKNKVKITTRVFAGYGEYVDVDGIAEMKINGAGDFHVSSSQNVDLSTAEYMLVPVHEVVGFDIGPVPYMDITGKGNIDIYTIGTVLDGEVTGSFHFKNTNASLQGLNTKIEKANGSLDFDKKDMHFYTKSAFIKGQPVKIDGIANLSGDIDFDVTSPSINMDELLNILKTSSMLTDKKVMVKPIDKMSGPAEIKIKIKGIVKDFKEILKNQTLNISGLIHLKNNSGKLVISPIYAKNINGTIKFDNLDWNADITGMIGTAKFIANGGTHDKIMSMKISADSLKTDELLELLNNSENKKLISLPKTNSLITFNGEYKSKANDFDLKNLKARGAFKPISSSNNSPFSIQSGSFKLEKGNAELLNFNAKLYNSNLFISGKCEHLFSNNPVYTYKFNASNFDLSGFNSLKDVHFLPTYIKKILNAYENYGGSANISVDCKKNKTRGYISLKDVKFNHTYFKTPVVIDSGNIQLLDERIILKSLIAQVDNTPVFINASVWDLDKTMRFSGYFTTKLTDYFANKYINTRLTYPVKLRGDITLTTDINGTLENFTIKPKIKLAKDADIYYMGANLGDEDNIRELNANITISGNNYFLKKGNYVRYMTSQNDRIYPLTIITTNGIFNIINKNIYIRNLNVETQNSANIKIFNAIFKKSVLKNGMFNCNLNIKGHIMNPLISGIVTMNNLDMPLYETTIKNIEIKFKERNITLKLDGDAYDSDFSLDVLVRNKLTPPYIVENLKVHSNQVNLDRLIDSLTRIPTPNTIIKMSSHGTPSKNQINVSDIQIKKGVMSANNIIIRGLPASNYNADFTLGKDMVLKISKLGFDITTGKINGTASYNFADDRMKAELSAYNVDSNKVASSLFDFKDQIFGKANGSIIMTTKGASENERIKNLSGYVYFDVSDGKMPKLGSVEYLLKAGNFIKSGITGASLSNFIDLLAPIKTGYFDSIKGKLALKNGVAQDIEVYSKGDNLNLYINGEYDILQQYANMRIYGRLTKKATNILGAVGNLSFNSILNAIPGFKLDKDDKMKIIKDLNKIPGVELSDQQYRVFTAKIDGKINEEKYVRSFRWIE